MSIGSERYVSVTTFTRAGAPKPAPVWIAELGDGTVGFTTGANSWKVRRLRNTPRVTVQPCDMRGNLKTGTDPVEGSAIVVDGDEYGRVAAAIGSKYGIQFWLVSVGSRLKRLARIATEPEAAVIITLDA